MSEDVKYLARLKGQGWTDQQIAAKMGRTEAWVKSTWEAALQEGMSKTASGYIELVKLFNLFCLQHSLMSESLKSLGLALADTVKHSDLSKTIESCPDGISLEQHILDSYIVLKRFTPEDPLKQLERHIQSN